MKKSLVLTLENRRQNFAWVYIIMAIITIYLLTEKKALSLNTVIGRSNSNSVLSRKHT